LYSFSSLRTSFEYKRGRNSSFPLSNVIQTNALRVE